ncbi:MAG: hypothetical protein AABZ14_09150, partial [Candidatus Margulisiibacteriota bacterium]
ETKSNQYMTLSRNKSLGNDFSVGVVIGAHRRNEQFAIGLAPATLIQQIAPWYGWFGRVPPPPVQGKSSVFSQKDQRTYGSADISLGYENNDFALKVGLSAETKGLFFDSTGNIVYSPSVSQEFEADVKNMWGGVLSVGGRLKSAQDVENRELTEFVQFLRPLDEKTDLVVGMSHDSYSTGTPVGSETTGDTLSIGLQHNFSPHIKLSSAISYYLSRFSSDAKDADQVKPTIDSALLTGTAHCAYTVTELLSELGINDPENAFLKAFGFEGKDLKLSEKSRAALKLKTTEEVDKFLQLLESIKVNLQAQGVQVDNIPASVYDNIRLYAALQACFQIEGTGFLNTLIGLSYTHGAKLGNGWLINSLSLDVNPFSKNGFGPGWQGEYSKDLSENTELHVQAGINILRAWGSASVELKHESIDKFFALIFPKMIKDWIPNITADAGTRFGLKTTSKDFTKYSSVYLSLFEGGLTVIPRGENYFGGKESSLTFSLIPAPGSFIPMFFYYSERTRPGTNVTLFDRTLVSRFEDNYKIFIPNKKAYPQTKIEEETISNLSEFSGKTTIQVCMNEPSDKKFIDKIIKGKETFRDFLKYMKENLVALKLTEVKTINLAEKETNFVGDTLSFSKKDLKQLLVDVANLSEPEDREEKFKDFLSSMATLHQNRRDEKSLEGKEILLDNSHGFIPLP